jgi:hypothetical protein
MVGMIRGALTDPSPIGRRVQYERTKERQWEKPLKDITSQIPLVSC